MIDCANLLSQSLARLVSSQPNWLSCGSRRSSQFLRLSILICLLVFQLAVPAMLQAQTCGYYVQTKWERLFPGSGHASQGHLNLGRNHQASFDSSQPGGQLRVSHTEPLDQAFEYLVASEKLRVSRLVESRDGLPDSNKPCNGPGCRSSQPIPQTVALASFEWQPTTLAVLVDLVSYSDMMVVWRSDRSHFSLPTTSNGILRPPQ